MDRIEAVLKFWFGELDENGQVSEGQKQLWFKKSDTTDQKIQEEFEEDVLQGAAGKRDHWAESPRGRLALIITLDQFPRNIYRNTPQAFAYDNKALEWSVSGCDLGMDKQLAPIERLFFYLPMEHSEILELQNRCVALFEQMENEVSESQKERFVDLTRYAVRHRDIIQQFGRFPHRNSILNRSSTEEEIEFLKQPGAGF